VFNEHSRKQEKTDKERAFLGKKEAAVHDFSIVKATASFNLYYTI
jgi:hypothetical protein